MTDHDLVDPTRDPLEDRMPGDDPADLASGGSRPPRRWGRIANLALLAGGAVLFLFPFYYMVVGSLQREPDTTVGGAFPTGGFTLHNYAQINDRVDLLQSLLNSGIFTGGVLLGTIVFGVLAGYALARLQFRGRGTLFAVMLLVQIVPFQLLIIPIYVMIVRTYGLADSYLGMILPFLINSTAVFVFRQFFLSLPDDLFAAAALDGAGELRILWSVALPLVRPALLTALLLTFIGPWNEFLWPFLVTKDTGMQPLAVTLANYIANIAGRAANPYGAILAGAVVLAAPAVVLFVAFQRHFTSSNLSSGVKG
jgi:multiple sugar transport system permease protein